MLFVVRPSLSWANIIIKKNIWIYSPRIAEVALLALRYKGSNWTGGLEQYHSPKELKELIGATQCNGSGDRFRYNQAIFNWTMITGGGCCFADPSVKIRFLETESRRFERMQIWKFLFHKSWFLSIFHRHQLTRTQFASQKMAGSRWHPHNSTRKFHALFGSMQLGIFAYINGWLFLVYGKCR